MKTAIRGLVTAFLALVGPAFAQEAKDPWVGKRVVTHLGAVLKVGDKIADDGLTDFRVYRVEQAKGGWLWLKSEKDGVAGWVQPQHVLPFDQAIDYYTGLIRTRPIGTYYYTRGLIWDDKGEFDIAVSDYSEAIRLEPGEAMYWSTRGLAWDSKGEYDKAIADLGEAIRLDPKNATAYHNRGLTWIGKKQYDRALADYNEAIRLGSKSPVTYLNRGFVWDHKGEYDKALADYNEAIRLDPTFNLAYNNRGEIWSLKKEYAKAIADYNEAIRLDPRFATPYNSRAWLWATCPNEKYRDGKKAVESATRACELTEWKDAEKLGTLAAAHAEAGDFAKSIEWQEKANKLFTDAEDKKKHEERLKLYKAKKPYRDVD